MRVSVQTVKQYTDINVGVDELVAKINAQLGGVEGVIDFGTRYKDATVVRVVSCEKHPNADKLSVCQIDVGGDSLVQVVCGAPNVHTDMYAVWLPPESTVPASFDDETPFVLGVRELRGVVSNGMLASAAELGIGDDHSGIIELDPQEWRPNDTDLKPGVKLTQLYNLDDYLIDIENKMFTHRPDLFGQVGVAREIAGIQHIPFRSPDWYSQQSVQNTPIKDDGLALQVRNEAPELVPRFVALSVRDVTVKPSPLWLQIELVRLGGKPINNVVDITNYIMLLTAQPVHAYDYDKLQSGTLVARTARENEQVTLLNGKTYSLNRDDIVIADAERPVGLAGIMGGGESEVSEDTRNIVLEVATFDMYALRRTSMRHGIFTDALTRFNKGQSPHQNLVVLHKLIDYISRITGGTVASPVFDEQGRMGIRESVHITPTFINERLGLSLVGDEITKLLTNVEFTVSGDDELEIVPPFWRTDISLPEDIVEEVGRLYGYDRLPRELPFRSIRPTPQNSSRELAWRMREILSRAGANEVLTYSFVHEHVISRARQDHQDAYRLANALSPDLQYYRLSITPSILDKVHGNVKAGYDEFALYEIGKAHSKRAGLDAEGLPVELRRVALTIVSRHTKAGSPYYRAKALLEFLTSQLGLVLEYRPLLEGSSLTIAQPFEPKRTARVIDRSSGQVIGVLGEYAQVVKRAFKLPDYSAGFELMPEAVELALAQAQHAYAPLSRYPHISRDVSIRVADNISYHDLVSHAQAGLSDMSTEAEIYPIAIYQPDNTQAKTITIRIVLTPRDKTLSSDEANMMIERMIRAMSEHIDVQVV